MATTHFHLLRYTNQTKLLHNYSLYAQVPNSWTCAPRSVNAALIRHRFSSTTIKRDNDRPSSSSPSSLSASAENSNGSNDSSGKIKDTQEAEAGATENDAQKRLTEEMEKKRVAAEDAALKEILDSAAAEKRKLEEQALRAIQERERQAAAAAAAAKATAVKEAAERLRQSKLISNASDVAAPIASTKPRTVPNASISTTSTQHGSKDFGDNNQSTISDTPDYRQNSAQQQQQHEQKQGDSVKQQGREHLFLGEDPLSPFKAKLLPYKKSLESSTEYMRSAIPDSLRQLSESVKRKDYRDTIAQLADHLNNFTGYNAINDLKVKVITHGDSLDEARIKLIEAKQAYEDAISRRSDTQKAINDLLQRKHLWSPDDVVRFTDLYRSEHANEQAEQKARIEYKQAESDVESKSRMLTRVIMERYHEEQVWSDKIRAASTYGTWGLVGVNVMAFLIVQAFVEPRRRRKQVERYEELVQDLTERGVLPEKRTTPTTLVSASPGAPTAAMTDFAPRNNSSSSPSPVFSSTAVAEGAGVTVTDDENAAITPVTVGGALLGGENILQKMMGIAERQEERLDRMEKLLVKGGPAPKAAIQGMDGSSESGDIILGEDGEVVFLSKDDKIEGEAADVGVDMSDAWREEMNKPRIQTKSSQNRLSLILSDGDAEVRATRRDFLVSSLGGALIGGLIAVAMMLRQ